MTLAFWYWACIVPFLSSIRLSVWVVQLRGTIWLRYNVIKVISVPYALVTTRGAVLVPRWLSWLWRMLYRWASAAEFSFVALRKCCRKC